MPSTSLLFTEILPLAFSALAPYLQRPRFMSPKVSPKPQCKFGQTQPIISSTALDTVSLNYLENSDSSVDKGKAHFLPKMETKCRAPTAQRGSRKSG